MYRFYVAKNGSDYNEGTIEKPFRTMEKAQMAVRELIVFKHDSELGNAPVHKLFDLVKVSRKDESGMPARAYSDYDVSVNEAALPAGVTCTRMI